MALRAAVVGAGNMGRHHIRILGSMPEVELVAIVDADESRAQAYARPGVSVFTDTAELPEVDIAVVATPTHLHVPVAEGLLRRGVSCLVEKPLAPTPEEADALVSLAREQGVVLAAGHVERFNPAVRVLASLAKEPVLMQFERLSPYTPRIAESIVFDLMVHDLDLACWIAGGYPTKIEAAGVRTFSDTLDAASAVLTFDNGRMATLQASRVTQDKIRRIQVSERDRFIVADSMTQDVSIKREVTVEFADEMGALYRQSSVVEHPYIDRRGEPLALELADFVAAVREGRAPTVTGDAGAAAVRLAHQVERAASSS